MMIKRKYNQEWRADPSRERWDPRRGSIVWESVEEMSVVWLSLERVCMWSGSPLAVMSMIKKNSTQKKIKNGSETLDSGCFVFVLQLPGDCLCLWKVTVISQFLAETYLTHFVG